MLPTVRLASFFLAALLLAPGLAPAKTTFSNSRALAFGKFVPGTGGTVVVSPAGVRTRTGGVFLVNSTVSSAAFTWSDTSPANANKICIIGLPADGTVVLTSGTNQMALNKFTSSPSGTSPMTAGSLNFMVGATLTVNPNQAKGNYSGTISVTIAYQ